MDGTRERISRILEFAALKQPIAAQLAIPPVRIYGLPHNTVAVTIHGLVLGPVSPKEQIVVRKTTSGPSDSRHGTVVENSTIR